MFSCVGRGIFLVHLERWHAARKVGSSCEIAEALHRDHPLVLDVNGFLSYLVRIAVPSIWQLWTFDASHGGHLVVSVSPGD